MFSAEKGDVNAPCKEDGVCNDGNAECVRGRCRCQQDNFFNNHTCGKFV